MFAELLYFEMMEKVRTDGFNITKKESGLKQYMREIRLALKAMVYK